jgi:uncharacterized membrane protein
MKTEITTGRILSIDVLRGLVIVLMALDHVRDYFHDDAFIHDPMDLNTTTPALYFTRWITHFCAPVFIFLAGISAYLSGSKKSPKDVQLFLLKRGVWLILIELTVVNFGWMFNPFFSASILQVIWAIGACMVLLALVVRLPQKVILGLGIVIISLHNLLDLLPGSTQATFIYNLFHTSGFKPFVVTENYSIVTVYGVLPWFGIMCLGYGLAFIFNRGFDSTQRRKILLRSGFGMLLLFAVLRLINGYGDPTPYTIQPTFINTVLSFLDVSKYPPSLMYSLLMLGPALLFLAWFETTQNVITSKLKIFGSVPFYFYVLHIYAIHILVVPLFFAQGYTTADIVQRPFWFRPDVMGFNLYGVYAVWLFVVAILYPLCKWYYNYKLSHKHWWLSYV